MNEDRRQAIVDAAEKAERAAMAYQAAQAMNVPQDLEKRILAAREYALARAEYADAKAELEKLLNTPAPPSHP